MMSQTAIILSMTVVAAVFLLMIGYIIYGSRQNARNRDGYRWQPEQDYDVVLRGETPMTPGFPTLVKREKPNGKVGETHPAKEEK